MSDLHPIFGTKIPSGWTSLVVDDIKAPVKSACVAGPFGSNIASKYFVAEGVPVIRGGNLTDDLTPFIAEGFVFVSSKQSQQYKAQHVAAGDLVFTCWGTVGQVGLIPEDGPFDEYIISNKQLKLRPDATRVDSRFLFYYFAGPRAVEYIRNRAIGAAVPGINLGTLKALPVILPPLPTQRKVVAILAAYDDLIQNNNRRIKILVEMARRIYREWFVDFRYPGHENVPLVDSELGLIPEGWSVGSVDDVASIARGRSYRGRDVVDSGGLPFINLKCVDREGGFRRDGLKRYSGPYKSDQVVGTGDIVMAVTDMTQERRIVARGARVPRLGEDFGVISMDLVKVCPRERVAPDFLLGLLRFSPFPDEVKGHANGANVLHLHPDRILAYRFSQPPEELMSRYGALAASLYELCDVLGEANQRLTASRNLVLPRLISGCLDVEDMDIAGDVGAG